MLVILTHIKACSTKPFTLFWHAFRKCSVLLFFQIITHILKKSMLADAGKILIIGTVWTLQGKGIRDSACKLPISVMIFFPCLDKKHETMGEEMNVEMKENVSGGRGPR